MCELFAMSSRIPTCVSFSFAEFSKHGGMTGPHKDGWGIAYFDGPDVELFKEPNAASNSAFVQFIRENQFVSNLVISHIRLATQGEVALKNTHPFARELGGRMHVFAHNGKLDGIYEDRTVRLGHFQPVGDTDSEYAFCYLMAMMEPLWGNGRMPSLDERIDVVSRFATTLRVFGPGNFLYADSDALFAHGHMRTQPDGEIRPPGLYRLCRTCEKQIKHAHMDHLDIEGLDLGFTTDNQDVMLIASVPLTDEHWIPFAEGELVVMREGVIVKRRTPVMA